MSPLVSSLWITLIGMAIIFAAVLLLWGLMDVLMRLTARFAVEEEEGEGEESEVPAEAIAPADTGLKKRAAAAAVAVALRLRRPVAIIPPSRAAGSAWQSVNRSSQLNPPAHIQRKPRGSAR